ncbi:MAG: aminotransferase class III-fold pyridoxal phosphate-dependent enzyme, partial [Pseudomonadota bacterium]
MPTYARADIAFVRGDGARLYDEAGRSYLDFAAGIAVNALGHCHPKMVAALKAQAETLWHVSNLYRSPGQERLAQRLIDHSFADTVFFCNSGAEAVEGVIKLARRHHFAAGAPERNRVIVATGAFHGRTLATIAAGDSEKARLGFDPATDGFDRVPFGDMNALRASVNDPEISDLIGVTPVFASAVVNPRGTSNPGFLITLFSRYGDGGGITNLTFTTGWPRGGSNVSSEVAGLNFTQLGELFSGIARERTMLVAQIENDQCRPIYT